MRHRLSTILTLVAAATALLAGAWLGMTTFSSGSGLPELKGATLLPEPRALASFRLIDFDRNPFTRQHLQERWTFLFIGYTYCPDVCPLTLATLNSVHRILEGSAVAPDTAYVFVSVDPRRDDPQRLKDYVAHFNDAFVGATGEPAMLEQLAKQLGLLFEVPRDPPTEDYAVAHSAYVVLIGPKADLEAYFTPPLEPAGMVDAYRKIRAYRQGS